MHIPALDGLRGVAILAVLVFHLISLQSTSGPMGRIAAACIRSLWVGVDLFFVLSGFLITGILLNTREKPAYFRRFYVRRSLRIFPLYYVVVSGGLVLALVGAVPASLGIPASPKTYLPVLAYVTNCCVFDGHYDRFGSYFIFWSLAVEEHFYLVWPMVVYLCTPRRLAYACLATCGLAGGVRVALWARHVPPIAVYAFSLCRCDALALGALTNLVVRRWSHAPRFGTWAATVGGVALAGLVAIGVSGPVGGLYEFSRAVQLVGFPLIAIAMAAAVSLAAAGGNPLARWCGAPALRWLGRYSYGIYVFHGFVLPWANAHLSADTLSIRLGSHVLASVARWSAFLLITFGLALLSWHALERPLIRLKDVLAPEAPLERDVVAVAGPV